MTIPSITALIGLLMVLIPEKYLIPLVRGFLKNFGLQVETKQVNLTKLVVHVVRYTGAAIIGIGLVVFFVLPYYSIVSNF